MIQLIYLFLLISFIILLVFMFVKEFMIIGKKDDGGAKETIDEILKEAFSETDWYSGVSHADLPKYIKIVKNKARYNQWGNGDKVWEVFKWETCGRPGLYLADIGAPFLITAEDLEPATEEEFNSKA